MNYSEEQYIHALEKENADLKKQLEESKRKSTMKVEVDATEVDVAMKKVEKLVESLKQADSLISNIKNIFIQEEVIGDLVYPKDIEEYPTAYKNVPTKTDYRTEEE